jgi:Mrp family chromosome partitioning ATPase
MSRINDALTRAAQDGRYALTSDEPLPAPVRDPADTAEPVDVSAADQFPLEYLQQSYVGLPAVPDEQAIRVDEEHLPPAHGPAGATGTPIDVVEKLVIGAMPTASLEQYRRLAAALHQAHLNTGLRIIMIASAVAGEGKTLTSANLALTLSES